MLNDSLEKLLVGFLFLRSQQSDFREGGNPVPPFVLNRRLVLIFVNVTSCVESHIIASKDSTSGMESFDWFSCRFPRTLCRGISDNPILEGAGHGVCFQRSLGELLGHGSQVFLLPFPLGRTEQQAQGALAEPGVQMSMFFLP